MYKLPYADATDEKEEYDSKLDTKVEADSEIDAEGEPEVEGEKYLARWSVQEGLIECDAL